MNIRVYPSRTELDEAGAGVVAGMLQPGARPPVLGLATGGTPTGIYRVLTDWHRQGKVSFRHATTFNLDEYVGLPEDHPQSYHSYMNRHLFRHVDLPAERAHIPDGNAADPAAECARYDALLAESGPIDLQLLGLGHNGHIGFNEPASGLIGGTHVVELKEDTRRANARFFAAFDQVPTHAVTMGVGAILQARAILLVACGADKADIVRRALTGPIAAECPASLLQTHANVTVLLDREAARRLDA